jgi:uncharacterized protein YerC
MTAVRADVAAMLRAGATQAQISKELDVSTYTVRRTREVLGIPIPAERRQRTRAEVAAAEELAVAMLKAGATYQVIYAETRLAKARICGLRRAHDIPVPATNHVSAQQRLTVDEAFNRHAQPTPDGGHLVWTGPRSGRGAIDLTAGGRRYNGRAVAFKRHHGRDPEGRLKRTCELPGCIAGAHHTDRRIRQAHAHADQAFTSIFGPDA